MSVRWHISTYLKNPRASFNQQLLYIKSRFECTEAVDDVAAAVFSLPGGHHCTAARL
jgi:hypothetical protein